MDPQYSVAFPSFDVRWAYPGVAKEAALEVFSKKAICFTPILSVLQGHYKHVSTLRIVDDTFFRADCHLCSFASPMTKLHPLNKQVSSKFASSNLPSLVPCFAMLTVR